MSTNSSCLVDEQFEEEFLQCQICTQKYNQKKRTPKVLPCLHTFCLPCLSKIMKPHRMTLKCPLCCKESRISQACAELPNDHRVIKLLDWVGKEEAKPRNTCSKHTGERVYFFCDTCRVPVCQQCTVIDHRESTGHVVIDVNQVLTKYDQDFRSIDSNCKKTLQTLQVRLDDLKKSKKSLGKSTDNQEMKIKEKFEDYRRILKRMEADLLTRVNQRSRHQKDLLSAQHDSMHEQTARLQELYDDFRSFSNSRDVSGLITTAGQLFDQQGLFEQMAKADENRLSEFLAENERAFHSDLNTFVCACPVSEPQLEDIEGQIDRLSVIQLSDYGVSAELNKMALKESKVGGKGRQGSTAASAAGSSPKQHHPPQAQPPPLTYEQQLQLQQQQQEIGAQQCGNVPEQQMPIPAGNLVYGLQQKDLGTFDLEQLQLQMLMSGPQWTTYRN